MSCASGITDLSYCTCSWCLPTLPPECLAEAVDSARAEVDRLEEALRRSTGAVGEEAA